MAFTAEEELRVAALESQQIAEKRIQTLELKMNDLQTAMNNLASKQQMKALLTVRQAEIEDLKNRVTDLEAQILALQS